MNTPETRIRSLEEALEQTPTLALWEQARNLYKAAPSEARDPLLLRLYGMASVFCLPAGDLRFEKGRNLLRQAARRFENLGQMGDTALACLYQAEAERKLGQAEAELQRLQEACSAAQWGENQTLTARALHSLGLALLGAGRIEPAEELLRDLHEACPPGPERWRWHHLRSRLLWGAGDLRLAARELGQARNLLPEPEPAAWLELLLSDAQRLKQAFEKSHEISVQTAR